jgi:glycosyltransferase involved in cell wall biosynthesis
MFTSLILCTHNPRRDYLDATIAGLRGQTLPCDQWEFLLIDNASSPERLPTANLDWNPNARLVHEDKLGLTPARLRGIQESKGDLLVFVDDDNILDPNYLEAALRIAVERPYLGSWSGQCRPVFDEPPPEWTRRYWGNLAIREFDEDKWSNLPRLPETMPCGAGLCVRREVALHYLSLHHDGKRGFQFDRTGDSLISGGDNDLAGCACDLGLGVGIMTDLKLQHLMPPQRLTADYLARLAEGIHFSAVILDRERGDTNSSIQRWRVRFRDWVRARLYRLPHRQIQLAVLKGRQRGVEELLKHTK